jgi:hypothetical protein
MSLRVHICAVTLTLVALLSAACDDKKSAAPGAASVSASASPSAPSATPAATAAAPSSTAVASAAPSAAASTSMITGDAKDVVVTVKDPTAEPEKSVKAQAGGTVTLFLPDYPGTVWSVDGNDKTLGKVKEEVIPGFAPRTNGHQFKWEALKAGQKHKVQLVNKKIGDKDKALKPSGTFALTIET